MNGCGSMRAKFSEYLDGRLTGVEMQRIAAHLQDCSACAAEWQSLRYAQASLAALGAVPEPKDLLLRVRVAVSQERARRKQPIMQRFNLAWRNSIGPFLLQASAGLASAVLLIGTVAVLVGIVAQPPAAHATGPGAPPDQVGRDGQHRHRRGQRSQGAGDHDDERHKEQAADRRGR